MRSTMSSAVTAGDDRSAARRLAGPCRRVDPGAIVRRLSGVVHWPGALDVEERSWRLIAQTPEFDAWLIAWPHGGTIDLHDHGGARGALHVIAGSLVESVPWRDDAGRLTLASTELRSGATLAFGAGHVHDVRNESSVPALSLHVYSPSLTSMSYYDCAEGRLVPRDLGWDSPEGEPGFRPSTGQPALWLVAP
jgi:hypothetical protein